MIAKLALLGAFGADTFGGSDDGSRRQRKMARHNFDLRRRITGKASLKQTGNKVTGCVGPGENGPIPVSEAFAGKKLTLKTFSQPGRTVTFDKCQVTVSKDKMTGRVDTDKGHVVFTKGTWQSVRNQPVYA
jgi:hypothetical protein